MRSDLQTKPVFTVTLDALAIVVVFAVAFYGVLILGVCNA